MHSSEIEAIGRPTRNWTRIVFRAALATACACGIANVAAEPSHKTFTPDAIINPNAFYPAAPQLIHEGLLVAAMPRDRLVLIANSGERRTLWHADGCGPPSHMRIPAGAYGELRH